MALRIHSERGYAHLACRRVKPRARAGIKPRGLHHAIQKGTRVWDSLMFGRVPQALHLSSASSRQRAMTQAHAQAAVAAREAHGSSHGGAMVLGRRCHRQRRRVWRAAARCCGRR